MAMNHEHDPLLPRDSQDDAIVQHHTYDDRAPAKRPKKTPLPKLQLFIVIALQFAEPVTGTVIYPFINQLVQETGITGGDERKTGYYAGVIESLFFLTECLSVYHWGKASDSKKIGRRPVLLAGIGVSAFAILAFGFGRAFWVLAVTRALQGVCNGNIGVTKSVMAEITDSTNMGNAFAFIPVAWATGVTLGPIIGGTLSHPAERWSFANTPFLRMFPYFLPCFVAALAPLVIFLLGWFYLKETLPSIVNAKPRDSEAAASQHADDSEPSHTFLTLLARKEVLIPVINHSFLALMEQCFIVLLPLVYSTSIPNGGLGLSAFEIGTIMGTVGFLNGIFQVVFFARILDRIGPKKLYILCYCSVFIAILAYPLMSSLAKSAGRVDGAVWCVLVVQLCCNLTIYMAYGCSFMYTVDAAPSHSSLGVTNGLAQMVSTVTRTVAPTLASSLFSISLQKQWLGGTMVYWVLCLIGSVGVWTAGFLPGKMKER